MASSIEKLDLDLSTEELSSKDVNVLDWLVKMFGNGDGTTVPFSILQLIANKINEIIPNVGTIDEDSVRAIVKEEIEALGYAEDGEY